MRNDAPNVGVGRTWADEVEAKVEVNRMVRRPGHHPPVPVHGHVAPGPVGPPELRLTDRGLVDINRFELVPLEA